jgi:hypothetical protein
VTYRRAGSTNFSVARCIEVVETAPLDPWNHPLSATGPDGTYILTSVRRPGTDRDPARYNIVPADTLVLGGTYLERRVTVDGVGAPVVAVSSDEIRNFRRLFLSGVFTERLRLSSNSTIAVPGFSSSNRSQLSEQP